MGCGSSSSAGSKAAQSTTAAPGVSEAQPGGAAAKKAGAEIKTDTKKSHDENLLPSDTGSPPNGRSSHRASRASLDAAETGAEAEAQQEQQPTAPTPPPPPSKAAEDANSTGQTAEAEAQADEGWEERLLAELNRQRKQVFSAELTRLGLRRELCAVAQRLAGGLADRQATVVSPIVDEDEQQRVKAGIRCHLMPRVLTKEESLNLNLYLAGLMAGMKAKEEDLVDHEQLEDSDASFWTLNGSFGCARATFEIIDSATAESDQDHLQDFVVLVLAFCTESRLAGLDLAVDGEDPAPEKAATTTEKPSPEQAVSEPEVKSEVEEEAKPEVESEPQQEAELQPEVEQEIQPEVEQEIQPEVEQEIQPEVPPTAPVEVGAS